MSEEEPPPTPVTSNVTPSASHVNLPPLPEGDSLAGHSQANLPSNAPPLTIRTPVVRRQLSSADSSTHELDAEAIEMASSTKSKKKQSHQKTVSALPNIPAAIVIGDTKDKIRLGIAAMDKKARSKPMAEILSRLDETLYQVVFFGDECILSSPIEEWPVCDALIAFFSKGYPLEKAKQYVELRKPFILNDLDMQELLQDRRCVYDMLEASGIDVPRHVYLSRDGYVSTGSGKGNGNNETDVQEHDDHIVINGITINKPFVEKPVNAEDHNISIYYPTSAGGGCKKLFRKIGNRSSEFYAEINEVRRDGSYIYEEFVETQGTDVKMYTVGPEYGHAEARKSPTVDGKVERNSEGKEVRFPVILTYREKEIARRIVLGFRQFVCGFDILRVQEGHSVVSYVCDVNGWSFVKNSRKYYDDCAQILSEHILASLRPHHLKRFSTLDPLVTTSISRADEDVNEPDRRSKESFLTRATRMLQGHPADSDYDEEIASVGASIPENGPQSPNKAETKANAATTLIDGAIPVRELPDQLTSEPASMNSSTTGDYDTPTRRRRSTSINDESTHKEELRCVLAVVRHGDRTPKQKLKVVMKEPHILDFFHVHTKDCHKDLKVKAKAPMTEFLEVVKSTLKNLSRQNDPYGVRHNLTHMRDILERWKIVGLNRKLQIKPKKFESYSDENGDTVDRCTEVQLILKWGGNLTKLGEKQSIQLGRRLRHDLYPDAPGGGILRLHSTFRHDLKIKTSDEGRVMKTAAAFAKGLLELEGDLPPILVSLVHKDKSSMHMLDPSGNKEVKAELDECKEKITANLQRDIDISSASEEELEGLAGPKGIVSLRQAMKEIGNPRGRLFQIHSKMGGLIEQLDEMLDDMGSGDENPIVGGEGLQTKEEKEYALSGVKLYKGETLLELTERWKFIYDRLYDADEDLFDLSRIPDLHDNARFDLLHNTRLGLSKTLNEIYDLVKPVADVVVPQEYGMTQGEKRSVGLKICHGLLEKINHDLGVARTDNEVDMRYMINMAYSADLPINSMGRRIRTRLYFTSESHLHTVLNVLRFAGGEKHPLLSERGLAIINATPELCYLTQIVIRVFEDSRFAMSDPRRFRAEILFSPGATAKPTSLPEADRDLDTSRNQTEPLQMIGREGLTCKEVEDFFSQAIEEGGGATLAPEAVFVDGDAPEKKVDEKLIQQIISGATYETPKTSSHSSSADDQTPVIVSNLAHRELFRRESDMKSTDDAAPHAAGLATDASEASSDKRDVSPYYLSRKYLWGSVAVGSILLGMGCLLVAFAMSNESRQQRRWSTKRY